MNDKIYISKIFNKEWLKSHERYHCYSERFEILEQKDFIEGLTNTIVKLKEVIFQEKQGNIKNDIIGFPIRENDDLSIIYESLNGLHDLYRVYKDNNYLFQNNNVWMKLKDGIVFQTDFTIDYSSGDYISLKTKYNFTNSDIIIDYMDVVQKKENINKSKYKFDKVIKEIKDTLRNHECTVEEVKSIVLTIESMTR